VNRGFRLAALERLREARLEEATRSLAAARRAVAGALAARDAVAAELAAAVPAPRTTPSAATTAGDRRDLLRERLAGAEQAVAAAATDARDALHAWQQARTDLRIVQTLHARHRAAVATAEARRDQRVLDDLAAQAALRRDGADGTEVDR
jgi:flagellar biosynthesis chaperone FliJ